MELGYEYISYILRERMLMIDNKYSLWPTWDALQLLAPRKLLPAFRLLSENVEPYLQ